MSDKKLSLRSISTSLFVYGSAHATVDAICAAVIFSILGAKIFNTTQFLSLVILYNALAFGLQAILGLAVDRSRSPRTAALLGCLLTGSSAVLFTSFPVLAVAFAGIGNALFHVGGGSISLNLTPKKATAPGIFVAPGALGLFVGTMLGKSGQFAMLPFLLTLAVLCILMFAVKMPEMNYRKRGYAEDKPRYFELILLLVFTSIAIRSVVGFVLVFPWKSHVDLLTILIVAVVLGKGVGGILADRFGWIRVAVGALIVSIPSLVLGANTPLLAICGMFLFNITMPVTLVAISNMLPGRPGFAFGITCLALFLGALPTFFSIKQALATNWFILPVIMISALALYLGLRLYMKKAIAKQIACVNPR